MNLNIINEQTKFKELTYEENFWTGKRTITYDGIPLQKIKRGLYEFEYQGKTEKLIVKGTQLIGIKITLFGNTFQIERNITWYEFTLSILSFVACLVFIFLNHFKNAWLATLTGGIFGGLGGGLFVTNLYLMKRIDKLYIKIILSIEILLLAMLICYILSAYLFKSFITLP